MKYQRILLKLGKYKWDQTPMASTHNALKYAQEIKALHQQGVEIAIVIGGGNIFRVAGSSQGVDRVQGDYMGMLATVMNGLALQSARKY